MLCNPPRYNLKTGCQCRSCALTGASPAGVSMHIRRIHEVVVGFVLSLDKWTLDPVDPVCSFACLLKQLAVDGIDAFV